MLLSIITFIPPQIWALSLIKIGILSQILLLSEQALRMLFPREWNRNIVRKPEKESFPKRNSSSRQKFQNILRNFLSLSAFWKQTKSKPVHRQRKKIWSDISENAIKLINTVGTSGKKSPEEMAEESRNISDCLHHWSWRSWKWNWTWGINQK